MPDDLYDRDVLAWSERQAALLRQLSEGRPANEAPDWPNIIDEVETVGRSELNRCESLLEQGLMHLLKLRGWPDSTATRHWRAEALAFLSQARRAFTPSMRQRIALPDLYAEARARAEGAIDGTGAPRQLPEACPFTLDELLAGDVDARLGKLRQGGP